MLIKRILDLQGGDTVRVTKVKDHADEDIVQAGRIQELDKIGNTAADEAADLGSRRVDFVVDALCNLFGVCGRWYPVVMSLHRFFIAISQTVVNHVDGDGTAPDPLIWSAGALPKKV